MKTLAFSELRRVAERSRLLSRKSVKFYFKFRTLIMVTPLKI